MKFSSAAAAMSFSLIAVSVSAAAERGAGAAEGAPPAIFQQMVNCRAIGDGAARLACYDREVAAVASAQQNRDLVVIDREQVRNTRRSLFGLTLPRLDIFGRGTDAEREDEEFAQIETTIASASLRNGHWTIVLADGARWYQTDTRELIRDPRPGMPIRIRRAAMGSFFANIGGQTAVRMQRVN